MSHDDFSCFSKNKKKKRTNPCTMSLSSTLNSLIELIQTKWKQDRKRFVIYSTISSITAFVTLKYITTYATQKRLERKLKRFEEKSIAQNAIIFHMPQRWDFNHAHGSPYCAKLMLYLEYSKLPYITDTSLTTSRHFKTQKTPWITYKNEHIPDTNLIMEWISKQKSLNNFNIDGHLDKLQLSILRAYKGMIEKELFFIAAWQRYCFEDNFKNHVPILLTPIIGPQSWKHYLFMLVMRGRIDKALWDQGVTRLSSEDICKKGDEIIDSCLTYMGDKKFMFGDKLTSLDLTIYGHIGAMYALSTVMTWGNADKKLKSKKEINEYMKRIEIECFGELKYWKDIV